MTSIRRLAAFAVPTVTALASIWMVWDDSWYKWHPAGMLASLLLFSANAVAAMRTRRMLWTHAVLQSLALVTMLFAFWVMFGIKASFERPHFWTLQASWHAMSGGAAVVGYVVVVGLSSLFMSPLHDKLSRVAYAARHRQWALVCWLLAAVALLTGWNKAHERLSPTFLAFLAAIAALTALNFGAHVFNSWGALFAPVRTARRLE